MIHELFLTQIGLLQNIESINTINILANNAFKHQITFVDTTLALVNLILYSFIISIKLQYNNFMFKELLIYSDIDIWLIGYLSQLKTL